jgi:peptidoglycan hydrolase-like protein with peptidoglycan-binding domain
VELLQLFRRFFSRRPAFALVCLALLASPVAEKGFGEAGQPSKTEFSSTNQSVSQSSSQQQASSKSKNNKTATRSKRSRKRVIRGQRTIEPSRVVEIQSALAAAGYYKAEPTGQWDESTTKAMSAYQQDNGFKTTGKPDALSLKKLGL